MKNQALFSSKDKSKKLKCRLLQLLLGTLRVNMQSRRYTLICLSIGTPKIINFPLFSKAKLIIFRCPKIKVHDSLIMM